MSEQVTSDLIYDVPATIKGQTAITPELYAQMGLSVPCKIPRDFGPSKQKNLSLGSKMGQGDGVGFPQRPDSMVHRR
jgi:hypothetical protein